MSAHGKPEPEFTITITNIKTGATITTQACGYADRAHVYTTDPQVPDVEMRKLLKGANPTVLESGLRLVQGTLEDVIDEDADDEGED